MVRPVPIKCRLSGQYLSSVYTTQTDKGKHWRKGMEEWRKCESDERGKKMEI